MSSMKCPHCATNFYFQEKGSFPIYRDGVKELSRFFGKDGYDVTHGFCPECEGLIVLLRLGYLVEVADTCWLNAERNDILYPKFSSRPVEPEVPQNYREDFREAVGVLRISPKASAALSRRMLQQILQDELGIKKRNLSEEIDEFISRKDVPSHLSEAVDAVRHYGNFAAHPLKDINTGAIVDVEPGEADWLLDVLESLFDFAFVQPKRLAENKNQLNAKLAKLGKPEMKGT